MIFNEHNYWKKHWEDQWAYKKLKRICLSILGPQTLLNSISPVICVWLDPDKFHWDWQTFSRSFCAHTRIQGIDFVQEIRKEPVTTWNIGAYIIMTKLQNSCSMFTRTLIAVCSKSEVIILLLNYVREHSHMTSDF